MGVCEREHFHSLDLTPAKASRWEYVKESIFTVLILTLAKASRWEYVKESIFTVLI